jgi:hypothetical protein
MLSAAVAPLSNVAKDATHGTVAVDHALPSGFRSREERLPDCARFRHHTNPSERVPDVEVVRARRALGAGDCAGARATLGTNLEEFAPSGDALATLGQALLCLGEAAEAERTFFCAGVVYQENGATLEWAPTALRSVAGEIGVHTFDSKTHRFSVLAPDGLWFVSGLDAPEGFPPFSVLKAFSFDDEYRTCDGPVYVQSISGQDSIRGISPATGKVLWTTDVPSYRSIIGVVPVDPCPRGKEFAVYSLSAGIIGFERDTGKMTKVLLNRPHKSNLVVIPGRERVAEIDYSHTSSFNFWQIPSGRFLGQLDLAKVVPAECRAAPLNSDSGADLTVLCPSSVFVMNVTDRALRGPFTLPRVGQWDLIWHRNERMLLKDVAVPSERVIVDTQQGAVFTSHQPLNTLNEDSERPGWGVARTDGWSGLVQLATDQLVARVARNPNPEMGQSSITFDTTRERAAFCSNDGQILALSPGPSVCQRDVSPAGRCWDSQRIDFVPEGPRLATKPGKESQVLSVEGTWRVLDDVERRLGPVGGEWGIVWNRRVLEVYRWAEHDTPVQIKLPLSPVWGEYPRFALGGRVIIIESVLGPDKQFEFYQLQDGVWKRVGEVTGDRASVDGTGRFLVVLRKDADAIRVDLSTMTETLFLDPEKRTKASGSFIFADNGTRVLGVDGRCELATGHCELWKGRTEVLKGPVFPNHARYWSSTQQMLIDDGGRMLILDVIDNTLRGALFSIGNRGWAFGLPSGTSRYTEVLEPIGWEPDTLDWFACFIGNRVIPSQVCWELFRHTGALRDTLAPKSRTP